MATGGVVKDGKGDVGLSTKWLDFYAVKGNVLQCRECLNVRMVFGVG